MDLDRSECRHTVTKIYREVNLVKMSLTKGGILPDQPPVGCIQIFPEEKS